MPINERRIFWNWNSPDSEDHVILARCVQEGLDEISTFVKEAEEVLKSNTGDRSFDGYDQGSDRVREQVRALFEYLQNLKPGIGDEFSYSWEPWDSDARRQRIRLVRELLHYGRGTCIDWVLLLASCLAHVKLNPLILITEAITEASPERHAILGYCLEERMLPEPVVTGEKFIHFLQKHQSNKLFGVVNATRIPPDGSGQKKDFYGEEGAEWEAITWLPNDARPFVIGPVHQIDPAASDQKILLVVDIRAAREKGIKPLLPLEPWPGNHPLPPAEHFQERPELEKVRKWWQDDSSYGVLALVGLGGVGKTALVRRFLAQLPGSGVQDEGVIKDRTLPIPDALFIWDFYHYPDVDRCATALYNYLTGEQVAKATFEQVQGVLSKNWRGCRVLVVFDGVEKLQVTPGNKPEDKDASFGQFLREGAPLAHFLRWCCDGPRPIHVLITSRFHPTDLRPYRSAGGYRAVTLGDLPLESACALLQAAGVKGLAWKLKELVRKFGGHALTLDLLGNYIALVHHGDPTHVLSKDIPPLDSEEARVQTDTGDTETPSIRLANILQFYEEHLQKDDPIALGVLQRLCLFHIIPVDEQLLAEIFSKAKESIAGPLAGLNPQQIRRHLLNLCGRYRLVHGEPEGNPQRFRIHRSIQAYFWRRLPGYTKVAVHKRVADYLASLEPLGALIERVKNLEGEPIYIRGIDDTKLDELEELIFHLVKTNDLLKINLAWNLYYFGLGAFGHLGASLGLYSRGERLARLFADTQFEDLDLPISLGDVQGFIAAHHAFLRWKGNFLNERGIYAFSLGELKTAITCYHEAAKLAVEFDLKKNACIFCANLCEAYVLQGRLTKAVDAGAYGLVEVAAGDPEQELTTFRGDTTWVVSNRALALVKRSDLYEQLEWLSAYTAYGLALRGQILAGQNRILEAISYFQMAHKRPEHVVITVLAKGLLEIARKTGLTAPDPVQLFERMVQRGMLFSIAGVYQAAFTLRMGDLAAASEMLTANRAACDHSGLKRDVARCDLLLAEAARLQSKYDKAHKSLAQALDWGIRTADQEVLVWGNLIRARLALDAGDLSEAERVIREGLRIATYCSYGLYWIDLQAVKSQWELACGRHLQAGKELPPDLEIWTPQQWFERAEASALRALNGQLKDSDKPAPRPDLPEDQLAMLGARHPECGYAWGEGDALHLLGEARLELAQCIGPNGYDSKDRSYKQLLDKAQQAAKEALALRKRIQDPKARETQDLLRKIQGA